MQHQHKHQQLQQQQQQVVHDCMLQKGKETRVGLSQGVAFVLILNLDK